MLPNLLFCISSLLTIASAQDILKQLIVVTRHGSRYPLQKDGSDLKEFSAGMLTAYGQKQLYDFGEYLRSSYNHSSVLKFDREKVRLESSEYERTVTSANSLALGLFPKAMRDPFNESFLPVMPANVPVYTYNQDDDILLRAYDKCPKLHKRLQDLYDSELWTHLETDHMVLLKKLAEIKDFQQYSNGKAFIPLEQLWNVFDIINVVKHECGQHGDALTNTCSTLPNHDVAAILSDDEWKEVEALAHEAELLKYDKEIVGKLIAGNLLREIVTRMENGDYTFSLFSAHYPTMLGIFGAMKQNFFDEQVIPAYASALIFEVTSNDDQGDLYFRVYFYHQDIADKLVVPLGHICGKPDVCLVSSLVDYLDGWTEAKWCKECENKDANVCMAVMVEQPATYHGLEYPLEAGFFIGLTTGVIGMLTVGCIVWRCRLWSNERSQEGKNEDRNAFMYPRDSPIYDEGSDLPQGSYPGPHAVSATDLPPPNPPAPYPNQLKGYPPASHGGSQQASYTSEPGQMTLSGPSPSMPPPASHPDMPPHRPMPLQPGAPPANSPPQQQTPFGVDNTDYHTVDMKDRSLI